MKNLFKLFLMALVAALLISCTPSNPAETPDETPGETGGTETPDPSGSETYEIGVAIYQFDDNFMTLYRTELEKYFKELEADGNTYNVEIVDSSNDPVKQTEQLNNFITQGKDIIIANLVEPQGADVFLQSARDADVPVVLINREPGVDTLEIFPGKTTYVGVDARQSGTYQGEIIADLPNKGDLNGDGVVKYIMVVGDTGNVDAKQRTQYSIEALEKVIKTERLGPALRANWKAEEAQPLVANALAQYGDEIEVIFANNDAMGQGALIALQSAGRTVNEDIYIVSVDALEDVVTLVLEGEYTGTVLNDHFNQSHTAADVALKLLKGEEVEAYYWHDYVKALTEDDVALTRKEYRTETIEEYKLRMEKINDKEIE